MKFGQRRRKNVNTTSIHSIKSIMVGKQQPDEGEPVNRSTQVLVNEGTLTSIEFTIKPPSILEATEHSFTSSAEFSARDCSFVSASGDLSDDEDERSVDPYLDSDLRRQAREYQRQQEATSTFQEPSPLSASFDDGEDNISATALEEHELVAPSSAMNKKSNFLFSRRPRSSTTATTPRVITLSTTTATPPPTTNCSKGGTIHTGRTGPESDSDEDHQHSPNTGSGGTTKLRSLGTFDFPVEDTAAATTAPPSNTKILVVGSFPTEEEEKKEEDPSDSSFPAVIESSFIQSPLSAIGKGLKFVSETLTLPKVLYSVEPPSTPLSQALVEEDVNPRKSARMARLRQQADQECDYWNAAVTKTMKTHGKAHSQVAEALIQLGQAYMLAREYAQAVIAFQSACRIWKQLERSDEDRLRFCRAVDAIGMAWARVSQDDDPDHCNKAMTALEEAFAIRYDLLGPWHVDTVETLNKMASVHLHLREYTEACNAYWEVFWVRKAIFGPDHPSVAIAAHALGNVFVKLAATEDAANFFQIAVEIYDKMHLPNKHPAVARLMRDYKRLDRICLTSRLPPQKSRAVQR